VRVELRDGAGKPSPALDKVTARVSVNGRPVVVRWKQGKSELSTTVPSPKGKKGPWVVRVEVESSLGEQIGRNFLEVAETPRKKPELLAQR
jgi:hypothetical protein